MDATWAATQASDTVRLMKPGPLIATSLTTSSAPAAVRAATIAAAASRGGIPTFLASASGALDCRSANALGRSTGSAPRNSSPNASAMARVTRGASASEGETMGQA